MRLRNGLALLIALTFPILAVAPAHAATHVLPANQVMVATATGNAIVIWDASNYLQNVAAKSTDKAKTLDEIQALAGRLLIEKARGLTRGAKTITVRVLYAPTALVEVYKTATFKGFEQLMTVTAARSLAIKNAAVWTKKLDARRVPRGMTVKRFGDLPGAWN